MAARKQGRPSIATDEIKAEIIQRLSSGEPLADICRSDGMPAVRTVSDWKKVDDDFSADFARAREFGHDAIAARIRHVARGGEGSTGDVARDRLVVETDLKLLAKWDKRYGDKLTVDGNKTVTHRYDLDSLGTDQLEQLESILAVARGGPGDAGEALASSVH